MSKIFITGGTGYIGSHTVLELARTGKHQLVVFDNLKNGHREALEVISAETGLEVKLIEGDLLNYQQIEAALASDKFDLVIHFAALIEAGVSVVHPTKFYDNNVVGSLNLIKAMQKNAVKKIVFSSTAAVYGTPSTELVEETSPLKPESAYGSSKLIVENILTALADQNVNESEKIDSVILRYFNAAGADPDMLIGQDYPNPTHLITVAIEAAMGKREKLTIFGQDYPTPDGTCVRDYIHVSDLATAHEKAVNYLEGFSGSEVINVGTGKGTSNLEIVKMVGQIHGSINYQFGPRRVGDPVAFHASNKKAKQVLGWEPRFDVSQAVKDAYSWVKAYPNGYKDRLRVNQT
jgi:UDP-glucose 4-epimerase